MTTLSPQQFVAKWRLATLKERSASQSHFNDLCALLGQPTPTEADPAGRWYTFEAGAQRLPSPAAVGEGQGVRAGFADVWKMGYFAWEYKGQHADLDKAYRQLLQYRESLLNPPLLIVSDLQRIIIHTNFTNTVKRVVELTLDDLLIPEKLDLLRKAFTDPDRLRPGLTPSQVTEEAARQFARLAQLLRRYGNEPHATAHFLIRLLFCLFAEDVGILPGGLFTKLVTQPHRTARAVSDQLRQLFAAMASGGSFGADEIPQVDGGLFNEDSMLDLDGDSLHILAEVSGLDWSSVEPSVLGTLFVRSLDPDKRSQLGAHYTSEADILLIVEPVLMAPLRRRWDEVKAEAEAEAEKRALLAGYSKLEAGNTARKLGAGTAPTTLAQRTRQRAKIEAELFGLLRGFREELAAVQVLDAACGSGNFLYVALRLLLDLEWEVITLARDLGDSLAFPVVSPAQLHGIEINTYAYELAQTTIWIGYIQWWRDHGFGLPAEPILKPLDAIRQMDAILDLTGFENDIPAAGREAPKPVRSREPEWPAVDVIVGNPPFLGGKRLRSELGDAYVDDLFRLYDGRVPREADMVCYWFEKARAQIAAGKAKRVGLLATQAIRGGANRKVLEQIKETGNIFWAQSDRNWVLDGATVHVSMVGFDAGAEKALELDGQMVAQINANLTAAIDLTKAQRLPENFGLSFMGVTPAGPFDVPEAKAREWMALPLNPNGRPNGDVLRPYFNGMDLTRGSRGVWIIDFGIGTSMEEAALYEAPFEYVVANVKPKRVNQRSTISQWWLHERSRPEMRAALKPLSRYIGTSMVSKHFFFSWIPAEVLPANLLIVVARADDYFFGVLHSRIHELWARRMGTQLREAESGFRYTPTTTFETFPCPWPPGREPADDPRVQAIAAAAADLVAKRDAWLGTAVGAKHSSQISSGPTQSPSDEASWTAAVPGRNASPLPARTLTNLYNARPTWLDLAHRALDAAVLAAYGWPKDLTDDEILARLLALNLERAGKQSPPIDRSPAQP